jgi:hypothetical protein
MLIDVKSLNSVSAGQNKHTLGISGAASVTSEFSCARYKGYMTPASGVNTHYKKTEPFIGLLNFDRLEEKLTEIK